MGSNASEDFLGGQKLLYWPTKNSQFGDAVDGRICEEPFVTQQTDIKGNLKTWDDGNPMMQLVVTLQTDLFDPSFEDDDGRRRLYVKGAMKQALASAVRKAGVKGLNEDGRLTLVYTHDAAPSSPGMSPARQFEATYEPPNAAASFLGTGTNSDNGKASESESLPAGVSADVWDTLSPEAKVALRNLGK